MPRPHSRSPGAAPGDRQFENTLFTAQVFETRLAIYRAQRAGRSAVLGQKEFYFGINDVVSGDYKTGALFDKVVFTLYDAWDTMDRGDGDASRSEARHAVARGQRLFNTKPIQITESKGLNDDLGVPSLPGACTTCHDTPNAGDHSIPAPLDIGLTDVSRRTSDMPLYTLRHTATRDGPDDGSGARADHRQVEGHRAVQGTDPARGGNPGSVFPQRVGRDRDAVGFLRPALRHRPDATGASRLGGLCCERCNNRRNGAGERRCIARITDAAAVRNILPSQQHGRPRERPLLAVAVSVNAVAESQELRRPVGRNGPVVRAREHQLPCASHPRGDKIAHAQSRHRFHSTQA